MKHILLSKSVRSSRLTFLKLTVLSKLTPYQFLWYFENYSTERYDMSAMRKSVNVAMALYTSVDLSFQFIWKKKSRSRWSDLRFGMNKTKASRKQSIIDLTQTCLETCQSKHCIFLSKINESKFAICKGFVLFPRKMKGDAVFLSNSVVKTSRLQKCTGSAKVSNKKLEV